MTKEKNAGLGRTMLWAMVTAYTIALPHVIFIYDGIVKHFSKHVAGKVPITIILVLGTVYIFAGFFMKTSPRHLVFVLPCSIIVYAVIKFEHNPNKHIHIPEYVILSWMLFRALSVDYKGGGIFALVFICAFMLGIVDEIEQGIYPDRFYGWKDMVINAASSIIGILTIIGLKPGLSDDWTWLFSLKKYKGSIVTILWGAVGAVFMCTYLFHVKKDLAFWGVYPIWLMVWNSTFLIFGAAVIVCLWKHGKKEHRIRENSNLDTNLITARLWVSCPLVILCIIHAHAIFIATSGSLFL